MLALNHEPSRFALNKEVRPYSLMNKKQKHIKRAWISSWKGREKGTAEQIQQEARTLTPKEHEPSHQRRTIRARFAREGARIRRQRGTNPRVAPLRIRVP